jgi:histidinol-phosphatase
VRKSPPSSQRNGSFSFFLGILITVLSAVVVGVASVFLHRIGINSVVPYGFIIAVALLFSAGVQIRYYFNELSVYIFAIICSLTVYYLATLTTGDILVLGGKIPGEKPWAGYLGWGIIIGAFVLPFLATLLPERWLSAKNSTKLLNSNDSEINFLYDIVEHTDLMLKKALMSNELAVEIKDDQTPVTRYDKEVEKYIRSRIKQKFPDDLILGEEFTSADDDLGKKLDKEGKRRRWIIDPIDGTKNFVRKVPVFATLIALEELDTATGIQKPVKSIISAPALSARWWASKEMGAWKLNRAISKEPVRISTSNTQNVENAFLSISSAGGWINSVPKYTKFFEELSKKSARTRGFGDFYSYMLLAQGSVDIATEPDLELYDIAALIPIVENAGGVFRDVEGNSWIDASGIKSARVSANSKLDKQLGEFYEYA